MQAGNPSPTAEQIASEAGVSLRTVFRHFEEMDRLAAEIVSGMLVTVQPRPVTDADARGWPDRLDALVSTRVEACEALLPFGPAIDLIRHRSPRAAEEHRVAAAAWARQLEDSLPRNVRLSPEASAALDLLLSAEAWQRLRIVQGRKRSDAEAVVRAAAHSLAAGTATS